MDLVSEVLEFWFGDAVADHQGEHRKEWFAYDPTFDAEIEQQFGTEVKKAAEGAHDDWMATPKGSLALCILLDQFSRNLFRGSSAAFENDPKALAIADQAIAAGQDMVLSDVKRAFLYLPFEHSETLADQIRSVELFRALGNETQYRYALEHHYVISRFGRFPTRNEALDRASTPDEQAFLASFDAF